MELLIPPWISILAALTTTAFFLYFFSLARKGSKIPSPDEKSLPAAGGGWPLIGHLVLLSGPDPLHITLSKMADEYGPIFTVSLGGTRCGLVVNSWEMAKECYKTNDLAFSDRPVTTAFRLLGYNFALLFFSSYGPYWREMRKAALLRLLSARKVATLGRAREDHIQSMMKSLNENCFGQESVAFIVDMKEFWTNLTLGLMVSMVARNVEEKMGSTEKEEWRRTIREFLRMMTVFTVSDGLPFLGCVCRNFSGTQRALRKTARRLDDMLQTWLEEHKKQKKLTNANNYGGGEGEDDDFMSEMLGVADGVAKEFPLYDADTINKAMCLAMMVGGTDTTAVTLTWALSLLLNNGHALEMTQKELDTHVGRDRRVNESDIDKLSYMHAVIKEAMRLQPPGPVNPRQAREDCVVAGHNISAGTMLFVNHWKIMRDPRVWSDPLEFRPERFLMGPMKDVDVHGLHFEFLPFGGGRRICPAIPFALRTVQLALASLLHGFDVETPHGEPVDMTGCFGSTNVKATPLEVRIKPRLSPELYP